MRATEAFELDIDKQDDLRYRWRLSRTSGRVVDSGVVLYIADCLATAAVGLEPDSRLTVNVDGRCIGGYSAMRMQLESSGVALDIAQAMLTRRT